MVAVILALGAALTWGSSDFFAGLFTRRYAALVVVGWTQSLAFVVISVFIALRWDPATSFGWFPYAAVAGVLSILGLVCLYRALATGTMGVVAPLAASGVAIPVVLGVLTGDRLTPLVAGGMALTLTGVLLASGPEIRDRVSARPIVLAAGAALCFGCVWYLVYRGAMVSAALTAWGMRGVSTGIFVLLAVLTRTFGRVAPRHLPALTLVGCGDVFANFLFGTASAMGAVSIVSVVSALYPVITVTLARVVLAERMRLVQQVGVVCSLIGVGMIAA